MEVKIDHKVTKTIVGLPIAYANKTEKFVDMSSVGDAVLIDLTADEKTADRYFQQHPIKYDFKVEEEARAYFSMKAIIVDIGGIYVTAEKVL